MSRPLQLLAATVVVVLLAGCTVHDHKRRSSESADDRPPAGQYYPVTFTAGVMPRMKPEAVATIVVRKLGDRARIHRMIVIQDASNVAGVEPAEVGSPPELSSNGPVWIVEALRKPGLQGAGYLVVDDRDGVVIATRMPR
jgi:hypothetical protein